MNATMTSSITLAYEGPASCQDCQRDGIPVCAHLGFTPDAWEPLVGQAVHVPGLDPAYVHLLTRVVVSPDRKTVTLIVDTDRPRHHDLARHLSTYADLRAKAALRAVHHGTGDVLAEGHYDRRLVAGEQVAIDRDLYYVARVEHPNRGPTGVADGEDIQVAHLVPVPADTITPVTSTAPTPGRG